MSNIYYIIKSSIVSQPNQTNLSKWFVNKIMLMNSEEYEIHRETID